MEQPIISKHCHALLDVPPIYDDVTEIARGQTPQSCQTNILIQNPRLFPDQSPKRSISRLFQALEKSLQNPRLFPDFPAPYDPWVLF